MDTKRTMPRTDLTDREGSELILSENAKKVLKRRILKKNLKGEIIETPEMMFTRVAYHIAAADGRYGADPSQIADGGSDPIRTLESVFVCVEFRVKEGHGIEIFR